MLSRHTTWWSIPIKRSQRWLPRNPAPPVINTRITLIPLHAIIGSIPGHKPFDAHLNRRTGLKADITHQVVHVSIGRGHIARLQGQHVLHSLHTKMTLQHLDEAHQLNGIVISYVVEFVGSGAGPGIR